MAISAATVFEVRTTGADSQGGAFVPGGSGVDRSQQDAVQVNIDNATITTSITGTTVTFTGYTPTANDLNNIVQFLTGTNVTVGFYQITGQTGTTWTLDRTPLTSGTTTNATAKMGGALASPGKAMSGAVASNTIYIKNGTYTFTSTANVAGGCINVLVGGATNNIPFQIVGYDVSRTLTNSDANAPILQAAASAVFVMMKFGSNYCRARNLIFNNPNSYSLSNQAVVFMAGVYGLLERVKVDWNNATCYSGIFQGGNENYCRDCVVLNTPGQPCYTSGGAFCTFTNCFGSGSNAGGFSGLGLYDRCIAYNNTGIATDGFNPGSAAGAHYRNCVAYGNGRSGFFLYYDTQCFNCVAVNNVYGFAAVQSGNAPLAAIFNCATFGNSNAGIVATDFAAYSQSGNIVLTGDPFTNAAGGDWSLTSVAGRGAALKGQGYPQSFYGLSTLSYPDVGAAQGNTGATVYLPFVTQRTRTLVRIIPKRLPALVIATPGPVVPLTRQRMWSRTWYEKRKPPNVTPGVPFLQVVPITFPPRIIRQRQMYPKRVPPAIVPGAPPPAVVITKPPRVIVRVVQRPIARKPSFIGVPSSGTVVLEEGLNVFRFDPGATSKSVYFKIRDAVTGQAKKSLTTSSAGANAGYFRSQGTSVNIPLVQLATATDAWQVGGFIEVDPANSPGEYRLDLPNAALASGADFALATLGFTNAFDSTVLIRLEKSTNNVGAGTIAWTVQTNNTATGLPLAGAQVWVTTDLAGTNTVAGVLTTNAQGQVVFQLNAGQFFVWISDQGYTEQNPTLINVA